MDNITKLESHAQYMANKLKEWELQSFADIAKKCKKIATMNKKQLNEMKIDKEAEKELEKILTALFIVTAMNISSLKKVYTTEFERWHDANKYLYDYRKIKFVEVAKNKQIQDMVEKFAKQGGNDILNITNTKALCVVDANGSVVKLKDAIYKAFNEAVGYVKEGRRDFYSAMSNTVKELGGSGCRVDYGAGVTRRLDTVIRQNLLYGVKQAHKEYNEMIGKELGCDGIEIDYHANARPSHRFMQGKQYSKGKAKRIKGVLYKSAIDEGVYDRLYKDYNCYHYETDIILGVSEPRYSEKELKEFEKRDNKLYRIGNTEKDGYEWSQTMRGLETEIRKLKDEINTLDALGGNEEQIRELKSKIRAYKFKYKEISDVTGISQDTKRMTVSRGN